jgi:carboxymethylenebutenolidase
VSVEATGGRITYPSNGTDVVAYLSQPKTEGQFPGLLVIQSRHGLIPWLEQACDRFASEGFVAIAPALYTRTGRLTEDPENRDAQKSQTGDQQVIGDLKAAMDYLSSLPEVGNRPVGAVGYCAGGRWIFFLSAAEPRLAAAVPYFATINDSKDDALRPVQVWDVVKDVQCPLDIYFGDQDHLSTEPRRERLRSLLDQHGKEYRWHLFPGAGHGYLFHPEHEGDEAAAEATWPLSIEFLKQRLGAVAAV